MTTENIMNILQIIATVIFGGLAIYRITSEKTNDFNRWMTAC